jgi:16S rRNA (cytosine1402-N4)-methyltransferase
MVDGRQRFPRFRPGAAPLSEDALSRALAESPHRPLLVREVLRCLQPRPGDLVVDATLGGGGHAQAILAHLGSRGRLIGLDVDGPALERTTARLRHAGFGPRVFTPHTATFADLPDVLAREGLAAVDLVLVDLGVSSMQVDDPARGFDPAVSGPLDLRLNRTLPDTAAAVLARTDAAALATLLATTVDEPYADVIAGVLARSNLETTHALQRAVRAGLAAAQPRLSSRAIVQSIRRTLLALRMAVNDELGALDRFLDGLPRCLGPGGRVAIVTFHSGEDRRVKRAFREGQRGGLYSSVAREAIRSTTAETRADRRAMAAKLRWAIRAAPRARRS